MKVAIYVRVSSESQTYDQQIEPCINFCKLKEWDEVDLFKEIESTKKVRPVFTELLRQAKAGKYKNIVVFRFDRAWRTARQFIMDFDWLQARGINVISVNEGLDPTTPYGKAMLTILVALAELERTNISVATKQRLDIVKKTKHIGRKQGSKDKNPRKKSGYYLRWNKQKGGKIQAEVQPETIQL